jgi:hypothetical protein
MRHDTCTYLLYEIPTAHDDSWACVIYIIRFVIVSISVCILLLQISRHDELEFPGTFLPEVVHTRHPASGRIW